MKKNLWFVMLFLSPFVYGETMEFVTAIASPTSVCEEVHTTKPFTPGGLGSGSVYTSAVAGYPIETSSAIIRTFNFLSDPVRALEGDITLHKSGADEPVASLNRVFLRAGASLSDERLPENEGEDDTEWIVECKAQGTEATVGTISIKSEGTLKLKQWGSEADYQRMMIPVVNVGGNDMTLWTTCGDDSLAASAMAVDNLFLKDSADNLPLEVPAIRITNSIKVKKDDTFVNWYDAADEQAVAPGGEMVWCRYAPPDNTCGGIEYEGEGSDKIQSGDYVLMSASAITTP